MDDRARTPKVKAPEPGPMVKKVKVDKRGIHLRRLALLAGAFWLARRAWGHAKYNPAAWGARKLAPKMVKRAVTP